MDTQTVEISDSSNPENQLQSFVQTRGAGRDCKRQICGAKMLKARHREGTNPYSLKGYARYLMSRSMSAPIGANINDSLMEAVSKWTENKRRKDAKANHPKRIKKTRAPKQKKNAKPADGREAHD